MTFAAARANVASALSGGPACVAAVALNANVNNNASLPQAGD